MEALWIYILFALFIVGCAAYLATVFRGAVLAFEASTMLGLICLLISLTTGVGTLIFAIFGIAYWGFGTNLPQAIARDLGL